LSTERRTEILMY